MFAFGCSFTEYGWPTWADILGQSFDYYENWGVAGGGNYLISSRVLECHHVNKFTKDDTVLVMYTSIPRIDFYTSAWTRNGNIFNSHSSQYERQWRDNNWSFTQGFYNTWIAIKQTKLLLDSIGCKYKLMKAFDISPISGHELQTFQPPSTEQDFYNEYINDIDSYFGEEPIMLNWLHENSHVSEPYVFKKSVSGDNWVDYHPTIAHHELWCRTYLSEYYTNQLAPDFIANNMSFDDQRLVAHHNYNINKNYGKCLLR
jgi:hypothetical protein